MTDDQLARELLSLGMDATSHRALALLPLVQVAWADGTVQAAEKDLIFDVATKRYHLGDEGKRVLRNWLRHPPSVEYARRGHYALVALCAKEGAGLDAAELPEVIALSHRVARAAGGFFGFGAVDSTEARAIDEIASALDIPLRRQWVGADDDTFVPADADLHSDGPGVEVVFHVTSHPTDALLLGTVGCYDEGRGDRTCPVTTSGVTIGRSADNAIQIHFDAMVSRRHCRLFGAGDRVYVEDGDSLRGTWVNGERIVERRLFGGETIQVGSTTFFFQAV